MEKDSSWDDLGLGMTPEECRDGDAEGGNGTPPSGREAATEIANEEAMREDQSFPLTS